MFYPYFELIKCGKYALKIWGRKIKRQEKVRKRKIAKKDEREKIRERKIW